MFDEMSKVEDDYRKLYNRLLGKRKGKSFPRNLETLNPFECPWGNFGKNSHWKLGEALNELWKLSWKFPNSETTETHFDIFWTLMLQCCFDNFLPERRKWKALRVITCIVRNWIFFIFAVLLWFAFVFQILNRYLFSFPTDDFSEIYTFYYTKLLSVYNLKMKFVLLFQPYFSGMLICSNRLFHEIFYLLFCHFRGRKRKFRFYTCSVM